MNVPTRLLVLQRLQDLLRNLTLDGVPIEIEVLRGRNHLGSETVVPSLSILENPRPDFTSLAGDENVMRKDNMTLLIQGRCLPDSNASTDSAYYLEAAVEERLSDILAFKDGGRPKYPEIHMLGGLITKLEIGAPVVRPPEEKVSAWAYFFLVLRIGIAADISKPYTSVPDNPAA